MSVDISEAKVARNEFGLWMGWTLATAAGMLAGFLPVLLFVNLLDLGLFRLLLPLWAGFLVGVFQWLVLRRYFTHAGDWLTYGGGGWALGYALGLLVIQALSGSVLGALIGYVLFGIIIAIIQWPVMRREMPNIIPWVIANVIGWALGAILSQAILNLITSPDTINQALSTAVISGGTGLIAGAITGVALIWIVRQPEV